VRRSEQAVRILHVFTAYALYEQGGGAVGNLADRLANAGQSRHGKQTLRGRIKADNGKVFRDAQAPLLMCYLSVSLIYRFIRSICYTILASTLSRAASCGSTIGV
jgi:hypothetical protein